MNSNIASPKALGFGVFAIALWMLSLPHSGLISPMGIGLATFHTAATIASLGLLLAGIMAFLRRDAWLAFFFLLWAGAIWGSAQGISQHDVMGARDMHYAAWLAIALTLVNFYLWLGTYRNSQLGGGVFFMMLLLWLSLLALGLDGFFRVVVLERIGGVLGLLSALVAFYVSAGSLASECPKQFSLPGIPGESTSE